MKIAEKERLFVEKNRVVIGWKKTNERASSEYNPYARNEFVLSAESAVRSFHTGSFKNRLVEGRAALGKALPVKRFVPPPPNKSLGPANAQ